VTGQPLVADTEVYFQRAGAVDWTALQRANGSARVHSLACTHELWMGRRCRELAARRESSLSRSLMDQKKAGKNKQEAKQNAKLYGTSSRPDNPW